MPGTIVSAVMTETVYQIKLKNGKYYVGKTKNFHHRMDQHLLSGEAACWVRKHGFEVCTKLGDYDVAGSWEETKATLNLMLKVGINNVRGAEYCQLRDFTHEDCRRLSYAVVHHLTGHSQKAVEDCFRNSLGPIPPPLWQQQQQQQQSTAASDRPETLLVLSDPGMSPAPAKKRPCARLDEINGPSLTPVTSSHLLFNNLVQLRENISADELIDVFHVFSDAALHELCDKRPADVDGLAKILSLTPEQRLAHGEKIVSAVIRTVESVGSVFVG